ncbi:GGDEF domain-containing protein [Paraburkholderia acidisoli]|uniref:diguanylate cyclase n=1 Tax=Paraburkholderia acidisoli TaxID=2571748 RepID=A0A7Z2GLZ0_9BURK|nr:GGDEF domain-containing protein [Paraburkholderia acidisoli]QGZ64261.1 diguanylate cyclase [Paraburkholderia acidisoli]
MLLRKRHRDVRRKDGNAVRDETFEVEHEGAPGKNPNDPNISKLPIGRSAPRNARSFEREYSAAHSTALRRLIRGSDDEAPSCRQHANVCLCPRLVVVFWRAVHNRVEGMEHSGAGHEQPAPRLDVLAEAELTRSGFRLAFPAALESRYWRDIAVERLREMRFIALWGVGGYFCLGVLLNLIVIENPNWTSVAIQLVGASLLTLAIIHFGLRNSVGVARREIALLACCLVCTLAAILVVTAKPGPVTQRDFLLAIPPASFVLIFIRLRFHQAAAFFIANLGVYALSVFVRPEISRSDAMFLIGFMNTLLLPALVGGHAFERALRRIYLHGLLERLRGEKLAAQNATLTGLSYTDPLTGVANRRRLDETLAALATAPGATGALLLADIDLFKAFNDRYGHLAGDACLCHVAQCLASRLRSTDLLARFGGEEFAVVLPGTTIEEASRTAERLRDAVQNLHFVVENQRVSVTISIGIAMRLGQSSPDALIGAADMALYAAKHAGRNLVQVALPDSGQREPLSA